MKSAALLTALLLAVVPSARAKGCFHEGWNGISAGFPLALSARFSKMFLAEQVPDDYRMSPSVEVGITGFKAGIDNYLVLTDSYCRETGGDGRPRGYWGANHDGFFSNTAWSLTPSLLYLWASARTRESVYAGAELSFLSLNNYIELMTPWKVSAGVYFPIVKGRGPDALGSFSTGLSW